MILRHPPSKSEAWLAGTLTLKAVRDRMLKQQFDRIGKEADRRREADAGQGERPQRSGT